MIAATTVYEFGEFRVDTIQRRLTRSGETVPLHSKAFDLLLVLMKNAGRDVSKDELLETVWPNQVLEESNLAVNISAVRKALGETAAQSRFIVTIPGYGYRFAGRLREASNPFMGLVIERETISQVSFEHQTDVAAASGNRQLEAGLASTRGWLWSLSHSRGILVAVVIFAVAAITIAGVSWWRRTHANDLNARFRQISYKQLTNNGIVYNAALSPDGKLFAFIMVQKEKESLRVGQTNTTEQIELRPPAEVSYSGLVFSHDGSSLFYSFGDRTADKFDLYKLPALGGVPVKLRDNVGTFFAVSPGDDRVAFIREDADKAALSIDVSDLNGSNEATIISLPVTRALSRRSLAWSPDGSMISFAANDGISESHLQLYVTRLANGATSVLSNSQWRAVDATVWLADRSGLTVIAQGPKPGATTQLWHVAYPGGAVTQITKDTATYNVGLGVTDDARSFLLVRLQQINHIWIMPADDLTKARQITFGTIGSSDGLLGLDWTPDNKLVYGSFSGTGQSIWTIDADGRNPKQITAAEYEDQMPSVSADGRTIVFESNRNGSSDIWRTDIDGANATRLTSCGKNSQPTVSPDSQWVIYRSTCDGVASLWRVPLTGGVPQRVSDRALSWPSVSPDGKLIVSAEIVSPIKFRLVILRVDGSQPPQYFDTDPLANARLGFRWTGDSSAIIYRDQRVGLWRQPIAGGPPVRVEGLPAEKIYGFGWSRDNKLFAYTVGAEIRDAVLVSTGNTTLDYLSVSH